MKSVTKWKKYLPLILVGGAIPTIIILGNYFAVRQGIVVVLAISSGLILGTMTLWTYANRKANGSEWWQDDSASGWRGY
jgi:hypothetical protein